MYLIVRFLLFGSKENHLTLTITQCQEKYQLQLFGKTIQDFTVNIFVLFYSFLIHKVLSFENLDRLGKLLVVNSERGCDISQCKYIASITILKGYCVHRPTRDLILLNPLELAEIYLICSLNIIVIINFTSTQIKIQLVSNNVLVGAQTTTAIFKFLADKTSIFTISFHNCGNIHFNVTEKEIIIFTVGLPK